ncbi:hypothetical protein HY570_00715 [Candidatus Micrarchaeota archaeon]|nr:hypothetical protein [Candidatus Micrarchaeota archaeon]
MKGFNRFFLFFALISILTFTLFIYAEQSEEYNEGIENNLEVVALQEETWAGGIGCTVGAEQVNGKWELRSNGRDINGSVTIEGFATGNIGGIIEDGYVYGYVIYDILQEEKSFSWYGTVSEKGLEGDSSIVIVDTVGDCIWAGEKVVKKKYATIGRSVGGREINITYAPVCTENCTKIVFIQTVCRKAVFADGSESPFNPSDVEPTWRDKDAVTVDGGKLCTVDYITGESDPYYNGDDAADGGAQGKHAGSLNAGMSDTPFYPDDAFDELKKKFGKEPKKIVLEFEVCAFCAEGPEAGAYYGCFRWNYEKEKGSDGSSSDQGSDAREPSKKFKEATDKWSKEKGFPLPK